MSPIRFLALATLFLLPCSSAVMAQTLEQKLDMLKEFRRFYPKFKEVAEKVECIHTLGSSDCAETALELLKLLREKEPELKEAARAVLAKFSDPATFSGMVEELPKLKDQDRRAAIVEVVGVAKFVPAVPVLTEMLGEKAMSPVLRYELMKTMGKLEARGSADKIVPFLQDREYLVRMTACDTLGILRVKSTGPAVVPLLNDSVWQVQDAAIKAVAKIRVQEAIEPLIGLLKKEGRFKIDASEALFKITSFDFGPDEEMWQRQWVTLKSMNFKIPTDEEIAKAEAARVEAAKRYKNFKTGAQYHGIATTSTQVLFVVDCSGSMGDMVIEREKFKADGHESFEKIEIVKDELIRTLQNLPENTNFNIVTFATKAKKWKEWLVPANITNRASAVSFVKGLKAIGAHKEGDITQGGLGGPSLEEGKTNTFEALVTAFDLDPSKDVVITGGGGAPRNKLDTIFFLSDGRPSTGKYVDTNDILREIKKINETRRIVLHCIAIGEFQKEFLAQLAQENGGTFVDLGR